MRDPFGTAVMPLGLSQVLSVGGIEVVRNIFKGPDGKRHRTYEARKASKSLGTFPRLADAIEKAKEEANKD